MQSTGSHTSFDVTDAAAAMGTYGNLPQADWSQDYGSLLPPSSVNAAIRECSLYIRHVNTRSAKHRVKIGKLDVKCLKG